MLLTRFMNFTMDESINAKISLGTAQWGLNYGVSNSRGKVPESEIRKILRYAWINNISNIDTSPAYGNIEKELGMYAETRHFNYTSKLPKCSTTLIDDCYLKQVNSGLERTLEDLGVNELSTYLIHSADDLFLEGSNRLVEALLRFKQQGIVRKIGISVYSPEQLNSILGLFCPDTVQIPLNLLDQRFIHSGMIQLMKDKEIEIQARSVFLQGLLLMDQQARPSYFDAISSNLEKLEAICFEQHRSKVSLAFSFVATLAYIDQVVIGIESLKQLIDVIESYGQLGEVNTDSLWLDNEKYIDPRNWPWF
jgi:aryl-alcohol dehydrogenase-like predicted oxidoreductase